MSPPRATIELTEYQTRVLARAELTDELGETLWRRFHDKVNVAFPSPPTGHCWELTSQGWVGYLPLSETLGVALRPKVPIANLFRMLEYAYRIDLELLEGLVDCATLEEFYERLANILALRTLHRARKGLYRAYLAEEETLPYLRGSLDMRRTLARPWEVKLGCQYEEHTPDIADNQILAWTLSRVARNGACSERVLPTVRTAYRALSGSVALTPHRSAACVKRLYHRLNQDYQPLHALCRFLLETSGPIHESGDHAMLPFVIDMAKLFEMFVYEWLRAHLPAEFEVAEQEIVPITIDRSLSFRIDLVLKDVRTGGVRAVLDTKYKTPEHPSSEDIAQVVAYAQAKGCNEAILIYPTQLPRPIDDWVGDIRVRSLTFSLEGDLEEAGMASMRF